MTETVRELCAALNEAGATFTFSKDCVCGLVGESVCQCWRWRGVEPEEQLPGWDKAAALITEGWRARELQNARARKAARQAKAEVFP